jgi:VanZ family protein
MAKKVMKSVLQLITLLKFEVLLTNRLAKFALVVIWMGLIFYLSSIPDLKLTGGLAPFDFILRKGAHIAEYAILAILWQLNVNNLKIAGVLSVAFAMSDELHHHYVPGRTGSPVDVLIDVVGIMVGLIIFHYYQRKNQSSSVTSHE